MCSCNEGYRLDDAGFMCVDINECLENPNICNVGECINEPGKYYCQCPEGYMPMPGRRKFFVICRRRILYIFLVFYRRMCRYEKRYLLSQLQQMEMFYSNDPKPNEKSLLLFHGASVGSAL